MYANRVISGSILIVDDEPDLREKLEVFLRKRGYRVASCGTAREALGIVTEETFDLILTDATCPGPAGIQLMIDIMPRGGDSDYIVMSAYATVDQSVEALRRGAADYVTKPFELYEVANVIKRVISTRRETAEGASNRKTKLGRDFPRDSDAVRSNAESGREARPALLGNSRAMQKVFAIIDRIAPTDSSVLITGATGTGKELAANAIHARSRRANAPFIDINCSAIPDTLVEAELFGHQRGTFTGANETRRGLFEEASGGTIFLDEIDALDPSAQAKLLRVIQERTLRRVGGRENIPIDVRIISAANGDLMKAISKGKFRADLFFRLRVVPLNMPSLRERDHDVTLLINHFLRRHAERHDTKVRRFSQEAMRLLVDYSWPGNVRELENTVEYALTLGTEEELGTDDLPPDVLKGGEAGPDGRPRISGDLALSEVERRHITATLARFGGHYIKTASALGIDRRTLYRKLKQYDLNASREDASTMVE